MSASATRYIVDDAGERVGVLLDIAEYRRLLAAAEALAAIREDQGAPDSPQPGFRRGAA
jgi:hypothetical protein